MGKPQMAIHWPLARRMSRERELCLGDGQPGITIALTLRTQTEARLVRVFCRFMRTLFSSNVRG